MSCTGIKGTGQEVEFGIVPATTWNTAVALDAGSKIKGASIGPLRLMQEIQQDEALGQSYARRTFLGKINQELTFTGDLRYENAQWVHIAQLIGTETGSVATGVYTHQWDIDNCIDNVFYTLAGGWRHSTVGSSDIFEYPSVKPTGFEITTGDDGFMRFSCTGIANYFIEEASGDDNSVINTTTTVFTTSTYDSELLRIPFGHCRVNINEQTGADFNDSGNGTDRIFPTAVSISMTRPIVRDFDTNRLGTDSGEADTYKTNEPKQDGRAWEIYVTFEFPNYQTNVSSGDTDNWLEKLRENQAMKAEILFYNTDDIQFKLQFPNLLFNDLTLEPGSLGRIPQTVVMQAAEVSDGTTAPTGLTGITKPMRVTLVNSWSKQYDDHSAIT